MAVTDDRGRTITRPSPSEIYNRSEQNWLIFAGTVLGLMGVMRILDAIWAFRYDGALPDDAGVLGDDLTAYGWLWLVVGVILLISSIAVLARSQLARWIGVAATGLAAVSAIFWMPYYPVWSLMYMLIAIYTMYVLINHAGPEPT